MQKSSYIRNRREIEAKMARVFSENLKLLPKALQKILVDDLVTAFESRFSVLNKSQSSLTVQVELAEREECPEIV